MKATTLKQVLIAAKWIIEHYGWTQGTFYRGKDGVPVDDPINCPLTGVCLVGAVRAVDKDFTKNGHAITTSTTNMISKELNGNIPRWNDAPGRTKGDVIALLDKLIQRQV
jgi:hypothetical protein